MNLFKRLGSVWGLGAPFVVFIIAIAMFVGGCTTLKKQGRIFEADRPQVEVIAHRGASAYAPENTLAAFDLAAEQKADWFELDCYLSKDDQVIVFHDGTVDRTTNGTGPVQEKTLDELKMLDAGLWKGAEFEHEPIPTLYEALAQAKSRIGVYVEIKNSASDAELTEQLLEMAAESSEMSQEQADTFMAAVEASGTRNLLLTRETIATIRSLNMEDEVVIQSFSPIICFVAQYEAPEIVTEYLGGDDPEKPQQWQNYTQLGVFLAVEGMNPSYGSLTPERLEQFHAAGQRVQVWTVNDPEDMARLAQMGVDGIITDYPDVCLAVLEELDLR